MRIVSYNILHGAEGRADPVAEVIEAQRPDVVGLVEADDRAVVERIAGRLNMDFVHARGKGGHASVLLSRWPIRESINHAPFKPELSRTLLEATVVDPAGREWTFGVLHLHAHALGQDEARRETELAIVLDVFAPHRAAGRAHVLMGDFNANSPVQSIDIDAVKSSTREEWEANGKQIPRRVVQRLLDEGYVDTFYAAHPQRAATTGSFSTQAPGQRVDYIFTHGIDPARITDGWVEHDRLARYASDHFPVGAEVEIA